MRPSWLTCDWPDYEDIVDSWGYETLFWKTCGSYQGDHVVLLRNGSEYGFLVIGYGSCSGCDALEASLPNYGHEDDWSRVEDLRDRIHSDIHWEYSADELAEYLVSRDAAKDWFLNDDEIKAAIEEIVIILKAIP